jgi:hypothetical protein
MKQTVELVESCTCTVLGTSVCTQWYTLACEATTERNYTALWSYSEIYLAAAPTHREIYKNTERPTLVFF